MASFQQPLTFGVEIEGILVFHQSHLGDDLHKIVKQPSDRVALRSQGFSRVPYNSWAVLHPGLRQMAYTFEPVDIAQRLISQSGTSVQAWRKPGSEKPDTYTTWQVMRDESLRAFDNDEKHTYFSSHPEISATREDDWDTHGIEIISSPYSYSEIDLVRFQSEANKVLSSLNTAKSRITTNESCGLHVHVGQPNNDPFDIKVLQHLAYLSLIYEGEISKLHPDHRYEGYSTEIASNLIINFLVQSEADCPEEDTQYLEGTPTKMWSTFKAIKEIRRIIFEDIKTAPNQYEYLKSIMGGTTRGFIINWKNINRADRPATIEFRQHAGTVDAAEISHWVRFCVGLVRLAYKCAMKEIVLGVESWKSNISLQDLMDMMDMDLNTKAHYDRKEKMFQDADRTVVALWELAPETLLALDNDAEGNV